MTRLRTEWIDYMLSGMEAYNMRYMERTGTDLSGLVMESYGIDVPKMERFRKELKLAAVPVTQGEGIIGSFSDSICAILRSMGFSAFVPEETDVDGIYSSLRAGADILFMADDIRYLAFSAGNAGQVRYGENNYATALGFINTMKAMMRKAEKEITEEKLLVIGYGLVGKEACVMLDSMGADFSMYDKDPEALERFREDNPERAVLPAPEDIRNYRFILDFTNEGGWLRDEYLAEGVIYASPGVPLSLDEKAAERLQKTSFYDNLEIGTAMMLGEILSTMP